MTDLFLRLTLRGREDYRSPDIRARVGSLSGAVGIGANALLFAGKLLAGILTGSVSITADAMNNLSDASSSIVTLLGFRLAQQPPDEEGAYQLDLETQHIPEEVPEEEPPVVQQPPAEFRTPKLLHNVPGKRKGFLLPSLRFSAVSRAVSWSSAVHSSISPSARRFHPEPVLA